MLKIEGLSKTYHDGARTVAALRNVALEVKAGEFVAILGASGSGKSTLLRLIASLLEPDAGRIVFTGPRPPRLGFMFQNPPLLPWRTALQNVLLADNGETPDTGGEARARECLELVGLLEFANFLPRQLSGGMQQRVALAQALFSRPELLLLDEPFAFLDEINRERLTLQLLELTAKLGTTVLFVTHSVSEAVFTGDRILTLSSDPTRDTVQADIRSPLPRPRVPELRRRPDFVQLVEDLRSELVRSVTV